MLNSKPRFFLLSAIAAATVLSSLPATSQAQLFQRFNRRNCCPTPVYQPVTYHNPCCDYGWQTYPTNPCCDTVQYPSTNYYASTPMYGTPSWTSSPACCGTTSAYSSNFAHTMTGPVVVTGENWQGQPSFAQPAQQSTQTEGTIVNAPNAQWQSEQHTTQKPAIDSSEIPAIDADSEDRDLNRTDEPFRGDSQNESGEVNAEGTNTTRSFEINKESDRTNLNDTDTRESEVNNESDVNNQSGSNDVDTNTALSSFYASRLIAINDGVVQLANLAREKSDDKRIADLAETLVSDHQQLKQELQQIADQPTNSQLVRKMTELEKEMVSAGAESAQQMLSDHQGEGFEMGFLGMQVAKHAMLKAELDALEGVGTEQFQNTVNAARETIDAHLQHARQLYAAMRDETETDQSGTATEDSDSAGEEVEGSLDEN